MNTAKSEMLIFNTQLKEDRDYWAKRLPREIGPSDLPLDYMRPSHYSEQQGSVNVNLSGQLHQKLKKLTGNSSFLLYVTLLTALKVCLYKYSRRRSIVVGSPAFRETEKSNGATNAVAIVDEMDDQLSVQQLLGNVRETCLEAYARQSYPFDATALPVSDKFVFDL